MITGPVNFWDSLCLWWLICVHLSFSCCHCRQRSFHLVRRHAICTFDDAPFILYSETIVCLPVRYFCNGILRNSAITGLTRRQWVQLYGFMGMLLLQGYTSIVQSFLYCRQYTVFVSKHSQCQSITQYEHFTHFIRYWRYWNVPSYDSSVTVQSCIVSSFLSSLVNVQSCNSVPPSHHHHIFFQNTMAMHEIWLKS